MTASLLSPGGVSVPEPKRILFVDDDRSLLDGLRDALRPYRHEWTMSFVTNGEDALAALQATDHDVVVSDLRMPGLDGATLLERVRRQCPAAVRIVLSGHADIGMVARAAAAAHRLIAKPCETEELALVIRRSCALRDIGTRVEFDRRAIRSAALPSVPRLYAELRELLCSASASAADVARVIERDIAMAAKVLQLANSAYFGRRSSTTNVTEAVSYLGTETLKALLLQAETFRQFQPDRPIPGFDLEGVQRDGTRVGHLAHAILKDVGGRGDAFTAGLLHDVGLLVLATQAPRELARTLALARQYGRSIHAIERDDKELTHAEIGAHLLVLWGLPGDVAEAVAGHHDPVWLKHPFDAVAAVQIATALVEESESGASRPDPPGVDLDYLSRAGVAGRLAAWRELAADQL